MIGHIAGRLTAPIWRSQVFHGGGTRPVSVPTSWEFDRDGLSLRGWRVNPDADRALLYFGGNAERIEDRLGDLARWFPDHALHLLAYRGYGDSDGSPSQDALVGDALALFDQAARHDRPVSVIGRSLGSAVGVQLAVRRPVARLALVTPFDSASAVARDVVRRLPAWFPLTDRFDSVAVAPDVACPVLVVRAACDATILAPRTALLLGALGDGAREVVIDGTGHNDVHLDPSYGGVLRDFLDAPC